jgi:hypothetical protein
MTQPEGNSQERMLEDARGDTQAASLKLGGITTNPPVAILGYSIRQRVEIRT